MLKTTSANHIYSNIFILATFLLNTFFISDTFPFYVFYNCHTMLFVPFDANFIIIEYKWDSKVFVKLQKINNF